MSRFFRQPAAASATPSASSTWWRRHRGFVLGISALLLMRSAVANWHPIPSASMQPTLKEGDVVLVDRTAYGLKWPLTDRFVVQGQPPARGDIITFAHPQQGQLLIKRVVGVAGDVVAMHQGRVWLNGQPLSQALVPVPQDEGHMAPAPAQDAQARDKTPGAAQDATQDATQHAKPAAAQRWTEQLGARRHAMQWLPGVPAMRDFGPVNVPAGHVLVLGDNRDNSADSRYFGFVPVNLVQGRAHHLLVSVDPEGHWLPRWERFGMRLQ